VFGGLRKVGAVRGVSEGRSAGVHVAISGLVSNFSFITPPSMFKTIERYDNNIRMHTSCPDCQETLVARSAPSYPLSN
jgi:hypothetical protein